MSSGDGGGMFSSLESETLKGDGNFFGNYYTDVLNYALQYYTYGALSYGKEGIKGGVSTDVVKEATGAKAAEEANLEARKQFEEQKATAIQERQNAQVKTAQNETTKSRMAVGVRKGNTSAGASALAGKTSPSSGSMLGGDERDFLGL